MGLKRKMIEIIEKPITDATAVPSDVAKGKVFYNNDGRQVGNAELAGLKTYSFSVGVNAGDSLIQYLEAFHFSKDKTMKPATFNEFHGVPYSNWGNKTPLKIKVNGNTILTMESLTYAKLEYAPRAMTYRISFDGGASKGDGLYNLAICFKDNQLKCGIVSDYHMDRFEYTAKWDIVVYYA